MLASAVWRVLLYATRIRGALRSRALQGSAFRRRTGRGCLPTAQSFVVKRLPNPAKAGKTLTRSATHRMQKAFAATPDTRVGWNRTVRAYAAMNNL